MAQSPEYPDLTWMPPKSWSDSNRTSVQLIVIHTTEGSAQAQSAEDGASYDQRRTDGTSTHYFHDSTSTVQCVRTADQAHAARAQGNRRGIQHELCTRANSANWLDTYHQAMLRRAAKQAARDARKWGIPVRHLPVADVASGSKGFCGHWDVTRAFPQDGGTHTDPGTNFPWSQFLDMVRAELDPNFTEDDMAISSADLAAIADAIWNYPVANPYITSGNNLQPAQTPLRFAPSLSPHQTTWAKVDTLAALVSTLITTEAADDAAKAAALASIQTAIASSGAAIAAAVIAALPDGGEVTQEMVTTAVEQAFAEAFGHTG